MSADWQVRVRCTDEGLHPSRELALVRLRGDDLELLKAFTEEFGERDARVLYERLERTDYGRERVARRGGVVHGAKVERGDPETLRSTWRFVCPSCRRDVQLRDERMVTLLRGLYDTRRRSVDISRLPAIL